MKTYQAIRVFSLLFIFSIIFSSCLRNDHKTEIIPTGAELFKDYVVASDFTWKLSQDLTFNIPNALNKVIEITSAEGEVYYRGFSSTESFSVEITLPTKVENVIINGNSVAVVGNIIDVPVFKAMNTINLTFGSESVFNSGQTDHIDIAFLSTSTFVAVYKDKGNSDKGTALIGTIGVGTVTYGSEFVYNNDNSEYNSVCALDANTFVVAYEDRGDGDKGNAIVGTVSGTNISFGSELYFHESQTKYVSIAALDASNIVIGYAKGNSSKEGKAIVGNVSGSSIVFGTEAKFDGNDEASHISVDALGSTSFVAAYKDNDNNDKGTAIIGIVSGTSISYGSEYVYNTGETERISAVALDANNIVIAYQDKDDSNKGNAVVGTVSGNVISFGSEYTFNSNNDRVSASKVTSTSLIIAYRDNDNGKNGTAVEATVSGTSLSFGTEEVFNNADGDYISTASSSGVFAVVYKDKGNSDYGTISSVTLISDADGDGIADANDEYPNDNTRAFNIYYPNSEDYGTLGFEDLWPTQGDYDFNDLVMGYQFKTVTNASNEVVEIYTTWVVRATGAGYINGFGFNLPDATVNSSNINVTGYNANSGLVSFNANGTEANQSLITIIPYAELPDVENTRANQTVLNDFDTTVVRIDVIAGSYDMNDFSMASFNPFIFVNEERGREIHLPGPAANSYDPTDLVDASFFGLSDDASIPGSGVYYKTSNNLPWVINIPEEFDYPTERTDIGTAYNYLDDWAISNGAQYSDWYENKAGYRNTTQLYNPSN